MAKPPRDPLFPASFNHRSAALSTGKTYHFVDEFAGDLEEFDALSTPTLLCMHGFPDSWYCWRHLIDPWVKTGYRVIAVDMIGYGETDKPDDLKAYAISSVVNDMVALLDFIGVPKAFIVGHDWGCHCSFRFAMFHPDRILGIASLSMPYYAPMTSYIPLEALVKHVPFLGYHAYLADPASPREIEGNLEAFFALIHQDSSSSYRRRFAFEGEMREYIIGKKDLVWDKPWNQYVSAEEQENILSMFTKSGMTGPTNWYRTTEVRYHDEKELPNKLPHDIPWLLMYGGKDVTCPGPLVEKTRAMIPQVKIVVLEGKGHWVTIDSWKEIKESVVELVESTRNKVVDEPGTRKIIGPAFSGLTAQREALLA